MAEADDALVEAGARELALRLSGAVWEDITGEVEREFAFPVDFTAHEQVVFRHVARAVIAAVRPLIEAEEREQMRVK